MDKHRCICPITDLYWDKDNRCAKHVVNDYIRQCGEKARKVKAKAESRDDLVSGLTNLLTLKNYASGDIHLDRLTLHKKFPFKLTACGYPYSCCGECTRVCDKRCVQDIMHRMYFLCNNAFLGYESSPAQHLTLKELLHPKVTYESILSIVNDNMTVRFNKKLKESLKKEELYENPNIFDYGPIVEGRLSETGRFVKSFDPDSLLYNIIQWPRSGLCPYCTPPQFGRNSKAGRKSKRDTVKTEFIL